MKALWIGLLIIGIAFSACTEIYVSAFTNSSIAPDSNCYLIIDDITNNTLTLNATYAPKYNITVVVSPEQNVTHFDSNITCSGNPVKQNLYVPLLPTTSLVDMISNNTYYCQAWQLPLINTTITQNTSYFEPTRNVSVSCQPLSCMQDINYSATYNETYRNSATNISVTCPAVPLLNDSVLLSFNQTYRNNQTNQTINCSALPMRNISINLSYSGNYTLPEENITVFAPYYPNINYTKNLTYGENYTHSTLNITIVAPSYPNLGIYAEINPNENYTNSLVNITVKARNASCNQNIVTSVAMDGQFRNELCGITVNGPSSSNLNFPETIQAEFGIDKTSSKCGIICRGPPKFNAEYNLTLNEKFTNTASGLDVNCWYNESQVPMCSSLPINYTAVDMMTRNYPNCTKREVCLDPFQNIMTKEEAFNGDVAGACGRNINITLNQLAQCQNLTVQKDAEIAAWRDPAKTYGGMRAEDLKILLLALVVILVLTGGILYYVKHEKKARVDGKVHPPKKELGHSVEEYDIKREGKGDRDG